jgi:hypothetical protein
VFSSSWTGPIREDVPLAVEFHCRSASSMPAAVQRSAIAPEDQRFTLRWVRRTISSIDSQGLADSSVFLRVAADAE